MSKIQERVLLFVSDLLAINLATLALLWSKYLGGTLSQAQLRWREVRPPHVYTEMPFSFVVQFYAYDALPLVYACWMVVFVFYGIYSSGRSLSRLDELGSVVKVVTTGTLLFLIATFDVDSGFSMTRLILASYWLAMIILVAGGRVSLRSLQRRLLRAGFGRQNAVIVGTDERGVRLLQDLRSRPIQQYHVLGFIRARQEEEREAIDDVPVLSAIAGLDRVVADRDIAAILIALRSNSHEEILEIVDAVRGQPVSFSITPDLYDIVTGHVRTNQIYGMPLMELTPQLMAPWQKLLKRAIDVAVALFVLGGFAPVWLLIAAAIKLNSKGPVLFRQERVGAGGRAFTMYKFRSMRVDAEEQSGPVWVGDDDPRVTAVGKLLRALHLDEIPQCLNFIGGDMSLVGPRPERPFFVDQFAREIPFYTRRFNVKPGLLGWAQSKHEFDLNSTDLQRIAQERLEYDLYYIENASLTLDIKIMMRTIWFVLAGKSTR